MVTPILPLALTAAEVKIRGRHILGPISCRIAGRGCTILLGPNGSGKTTLLRLMHGLQRPSRGQVSWQAGGEEARRRQGFVFQTPIILRRSVAENIAYPLRLEGIPAPQAAERARAEAARVGLKVDLEKPARTLSGGEKQKMALARALIRAPEVLFLDEPCANLDGASTLDIEQILVGLRAQGCRIVMSTHNVGQARRLADDVLFLNQGQLIEARAADDFFAAPQTPQATAFLNGDLVL